MTRILSVLAGLTLLHSVPSYGQTAPVVHVTIGTTARGPVYVVASTGMIAVTAFALARHLPVPPSEEIAAASQVNIYDVAVGAAPAPILPGGQITVHGPSRMNSPASDTPTVQAIVFAEGSSWGDSKRVQGIMGQRGYLLQRLAEAYRELSQASAQGTSRDALIAQFQSAIDNRAATATDPLDQHSIFSARSGVILNLQKAVRSPVAVIVRQQMSALNDRLVTLRTYGGVQWRLFCASGEIRKKRNARGNAGIAAWKGCAAAQPLYNGSHATEDPTPALAGYPVGVFSLLLSPGRGGADRAG